MNQRPDKATFDDVATEMGSLSQLYNHYVGSSSKRLKPSFEKRSHADLSHLIREGITTSARTYECNAVLCGHTHAPQPFMPVKNHTWVQYGNTGSFTGKLATAMVLTHDNQWKMINWNEQRLKQGLDRLPHRSDENPGAAYRAQSESEIDFHRTLHNVWMARRMIGEAKQTISEIKKMTHKIEDMVALQEETLVLALKTARPLRLTPDPEQALNPACPYTLAA